MKNNQNDKNFNINFDTAADVAGHGVNLIKDITGSTSKIVEKAAEVLERELASGILTAKKGINSKGSQHI